MKLNLLPTSVSKEKSARTAIIVMVLMILAGIALAALMAIFSSQQLARAKEEAEAIRPAAERAVATANQADQVVAGAQTILRNIALADAMNRHNGKYVEFYDSVKPFIPSFFRVTSMAATPTGPGTSTLDLTGTIASFQQYADLMIALMRIPGAQNVSRSGFVLNDQYVPSLTETDQTGRPIRQGDAPIPDDPLARLDYFIARGSQPDFQGAGGFGTGPDTPRQAMESQSLVSVRVVINRDLQTPDPSATLRGGGAAAGGGMPGGFGGPPMGMPGGPPTGIPGGAPAGPGGNVGRDDE